MAPATSRKNGGEGSRPRTRAASQRRGTSPMPPVTTRSQSESAPSSARAKRRRSATKAAAKERPNAPKRARPADRSRDEEEGEEDASRSTGRQEAAASASASDAAEQATSSSAVSTTDSSPLRCPYIPRVVKSTNPDGTEVYYPNIEPGVVSSYFKEDKKYCAKLKRQMKLATLDMNAPFSCLSKDSLLPVRESAMETVFQAAKFVVGLSSTVDGKPLARCSGFFVEWDSEAKVGKILTSGHVICTKYPSIHDKSGKREYSSTAQVQVHLPDDTSVDAELCHYDNHYHIALFKVVVNLSADVPSLSSNPKHAQEVFLVGRDENSYLTTNYGRVLYQSPGLYDQNHCMYVNCKVDKSGAGGLVISFDGRFIGMANPTPRQAFIPASIIFRCLRMWKKFGCIPRLHLGLKPSAIKYLEPSHIEKISSKFAIKEGFIVKEVSGRSNAEKVGIKIGDIITCWDGKKISTTVELDDMLLAICEDHLNNGKSIGSTVSVIVGVFHIRKETHSIEQLPMFISADVEVIARESYAVSSAGKGPSAMVSSDDVASGQETPDDTESEESN